MKFTQQSFKPQNIMDRRVFLTKNGYTIYESRNCGHRFIEIKDYNNHINNEYSDKYFFDGGQGYPNYYEEKDLLIKYGTNYAKILKKYCKPGKVLDVGCAAGFILKGFEQSGWECYGIDPNNTMIEYGRSVLNLNLVKGDLESYATDKHFELISLIQVIGHLHDLDKSMEILRNLSSSNGYVIVESWDMKSFSARILGKHWHEYSPPSVVNWFSDITLKQLFYNYGFELITKGRPSKRIKITHGISLLKQSTISFLLIAKILKFLNQKFGKYTLPYPPLDIKWYLFKKIN